MTTWIAVLAVGLGSYTFRLAPLLLGARFRLRQRPQDILRHAGMGGIAALLVSSIVGFGAAGGLAIASAGAAVVVAAVVGWRGGSMAVVMLAGGAFYAVLAGVAAVVG